MIAASRDRARFPAGRTQPTAMISYASEDEAAAAELTDKLLSAGYGVWLDKYCLLPGQDWESEIRTAVGQVDALVFLISRHSSTKTGFVQKELRLALEVAAEQPDGKIYLVPVRLDDAAAPVKLGRWHQLDMREPAWFRRLQSSLNSSSGKAPLDGRAGEPDVDLLHVDFGWDAGALTIDYLLRSTGPTTVVELGASLIGEDGQEHYNLADDRRLWLSAGTAVYRRFLHLPSSARGRTYRLIASVWLDSIARGERMASARGGEPVELP